MSSSSSAVCSSSSENGEDSAARDLKPVRLLDPPPPPVAADIPMAVTFESGSPKRKDTPSAQVAPSAQVELQRRSNAHFNPRDEQPSHWNNCADARNITQSTHQAPAAMPQAKDRHRFEKSDETADEKIATPEAGMNEKFLPREKPFHEKTVGVVRHYIVIGALAFGLVIAVIICVVLATKSKDCKNANTDGKNDSEVGPAVFESGTDVCGKAKIKHAKATCPGMPGNVCVMTCKETYEGIFALYCDYESKQWKEVLDGDSVSSDGSADADGNETASGQDLPKCVKKKAKPEPIETPPPDNKIETPEANAGTETEPAPPKTPTPSPSSSSSSSDDPVPNGSQNTECAVSHLFGYGLDVTCPTQKGMVKPDQPCTLRCPDQVTNSSSELASMVCKNGRWKPVTGPTSKHPSDLSCAPKICERGTFITGTEHINPDTVKCYDDSGVETEEGIPWRVPSPFHHGDSRRAVCKASCAKDLLIHDSNHEDAKKDEIELQCVVIHVLGGYGLRLRPVGGEYCASGQTVSQLKNSAFGHAAVATKWVAAKGGEAMGATKEWIKSKVNG